MLINVDLNANKIKLFPATSVAVSAIDFTIVGHTQVVTSMGGNEILAVANSSDGPLFPTSFVVAEVQCT